MASILVIDSYDGFRDAMTFCLPKFGHVVRCVADVESAIAGVGAAGVEFVLIDLGESQREGLRACEQLCALPAFAKIPIVAMTAFHCAGVEERARVAGAAGVLRKPFQWAEILELIARSVPATGG